MHAFDILGDPVRRVRFLLDFIFLQETALTRRTRDQGRNTATWGFGVPQNIETDEKLSAKKRQFLPRAGLFRTEAALSLRSRAATSFVILIVYVLVSAAAFNGYYTKWFMSDGTPQQSVISMLDGSADRPYVYRQLLPQTANVIEHLLPDNITEYAERRLIEADGALKAPLGESASAPDYALRYRIVYYLTFFSLFLALYALRSVCLAIGTGQAASTIAPAIFVLMVPVLQTRGGYFYDLPELLAFALAARLAIGGRIIPLLVLAIPATANKEVFFFFSIALVPLLMVRLPRKVAVMATLGTVLVSGLTYFYIRTLYAGNEGQNAIFQLFNILAFYANPLNLFLVDQTYGLPLFKGYSLIVFGWFTALMIYGFRGVPDYMRQHLLLAAIINVPLFLLFCAEGEVRNLSMLYIAIVVLMGSAIERWLKSTTPSVEQSRQ